MKRTVAVLLKSVLALAGALGSIGGCRLGGVPDRDSPIYLAGTLNDDAALVRVEVVGLPEALLMRLADANPSVAEWSRLFAVRVAPEDGVVDLPPVAGSYRAIDGGLVFEPRFPLEPGIRYRFDVVPEVIGADIAPHTAFVSEPPRPSVATTVVRHVYPSSDVLPENQLKFYVHFSAPMSSGQAYDHLRLLDASGEEIDLPFLELDEELWDPEGRRFTVFIDPGRIKRGVRPLEEIGPALEEGKSYTLLVDSRWEDAAGNRLQAEHRKAFRVGPPDRESPATATWKVEAPPAGTRRPVVVRFPEPLDHGLLLRLIEVEHDGQPVAGEAAVFQEETAWGFTPETPWRPGSHDLVVYTTLEDLAGNSVGRPFEVDVSGTVSSRVEVGTERLSFEVR